MKDKLEQHFKGVMHSNPNDTNLRKRNIEQTGTGNGNNGNQLKKKTRASVGKRDEVNVNKTDIGRDVNQILPVAKSPSDTTLYVPALTKNVQQKLNKDGFISVTNTGRQDVNHNIVPQDYAHQISCFVEDIRLNTQPSMTAMPRQQQDVRKVQRRISTDFKQEQQQDFDVPNSQEEQQLEVDNLENRQVRDRLLREAKERANKIVLEAEQYKAQLEQPKGKQIQFQNITDVDDEFFHITCHIDPALKTKIEQGDFMDLEKLLPRDRYDARNEGRVDLIHKDGQTYFRAHEKSGKINGIRKWEQAFRVYAAIYNTANPQRAGEIWQYVYVINTAAASYVWDDVAHYNYTFRQLMAMNPQRSWAKTYNQMWNLSMRNPIGSRPNYNQSMYHQADKSVNATNGQSQSRKPKYCWKFNKGICSEPYCKFPHKCYYCHGRHGIHACIKKSDKKNSSSTLASSPKDGTKAKN